MDGQACQDYAAHTEDELYVSDGCSTSTNTDIGARILTRLAMDYSKNDSFYLPRDRRFYKALQTASNTICTAMNLSPIETMRATLIRARISDLNVNVVINGDGLFAKKTLSGNLFIYRLYNSHNMPYYPVSYWDKDLIDSYKLFDTRLEIKEYDNDLNLISTSSRNLFETEVTHGFTQHIETRSLKSFGIFSDGVEQVKDVSTQEIVNNLLSIKNTTKGFLHRKINKLIRKENLLEKLNDDFSCSICMLGS
jgi:hypothetical protein